MMEARPAGWFPLWGSLFCFLRRGVGQQLDDFLIRVDTILQLASSIGGVRPRGQADTAGLTGTRRHITSMMGGMQAQVPNEGKRAEPESPRRAPGSTRYLERPEGAECQGDVQRPEGQGRAVVPRFPEGTSKSRIKLLRLWRCPTSADRRRRHSMRSML
jgi:hypothetical protein